MNRYVPYALGAMFVLGVSTYQWVTLRSDSRAERRTGPNVAVTSRAAYDAWSRQRGTTQWERAQRRHVNALRSVGKAMPRRQFVREHRPHAPLRRVRPRAEAELVVAARGCTTFDAGSD